MIDDMYHKHMKQHGMTRLVVSSKPSSIRCLTSFKLFSLQNTNLKNIWGFVAYGEDDFIKFMTVYDYKEVNDKVIVQLLTADLICMALKFATMVQRLGGQSDAKPLEFPSKLGIHLSTHRRDEKLSRPCPARGLNLGPVLWKSDALPLSHWASFWILRK
ncbi:hypothetical protein TNCV_1998541 [Trichonephila clavipes]|nr:hypothetical protein TNCV_1998541 [Trichonephila clavipes]